MVILLTGMISLIKLLIPTHVMVVKNTEELIMLPNDGQICSDKYNV